MRSGPVVLIVLSYLYCVFVYLLTELHLTTQQSILLVILIYTKLHIGLPHCGGKKLKKLVCVKILNYKISRSPTLSC